MPRYQLIVEYNGTSFSGWQWQANGPSVQQVVEEAIQAFAGHAVRLHCAGRTDAGVHALHQVVHVDLEKSFRADSVRDAANAHLRDKDVAVVVLEARLVDERFHARLSAIRRHYLYRILDRRPPPAVEVNRVWHIKKTLDIPAMREAASRLLGRHDFTTFRAADCQAKSPIKTLEHLDIERVGNEVHIYASSRSFLHRQVRSMTGTLAQAGLHRWSADDVQAALEARDRTRCGPVAPACGLYLIGVDYADWQQTEG